MTSASGLYCGLVTHRRLKPRLHALRYRVFMLLLDLEQIDSLLARLTLLRAGRVGLISFHARDHGDGSQTPLIHQVRRTLTAANLPADGPVRLLCMPRIFGHGFNPLSVYFCHRQDGTLAATLYEVSNTFGERHSYLIEARPDGQGLVRQTVGKQFHVSPFMDLELTYDFEVAPPEDRVRISILVSDDHGPMLTAAFSGARRPLTDLALLTAWITHPLLTLKVVAAIHWEALLIWRKGVAYRPKPSPPDRQITMGTSQHGG